MDDEDEDEDEKDRRTSDRILLAVLIIFFSTPLTMIIVDKLSISSLFNPKSMLSIPIALAIFADWLYTKKRK